MKNNIKPRQLCFRLLFWIIGQFFIASGIVFSVKSNLGVSAGSSVPYVFSQLSGVPLGTSVTIFFCILVGLQILILKKDFQIRNLIQVFGSVIFGFFTNLSEILFGSFYADSYAIKLLFLMLGILLQAIGIALYVDTQIMFMPAEGIITAVHEKIFTRISLGTVKVIVDCTWIVVSFALSIIFLGKIIGIREGTLILAVAVGKVMDLIHSKIEDRLKSLMFC